MPTKVTAGAVAEGSRLVALSLGENLRKQLEMICKSTGLSYSEFVRTAIEHQLANHPLWRITMLEYLCQVMHLALHKAWWLAPGGMELPLDTDRFKSLGRELKWAEVEFGKLRSAEQRRLWAAGVEVSDLWRDFEIPVIEKFLRSVSADMPPAGAKPGEGKQHRV